VAKVVAYFFIQNSFKCDCDHYKGTSVIVTATVLLRLTL